MSFTVGFDLDMTLIDPRDGMVELFDLLASETNYPLDGRAFVTRLGPPLTSEFARYGIVGEAAEELVERFRAHYADVVIPASKPFPGAREALAAVDAHGGRSVVVSGKYEPHVRAHLQAAGLAVDAVAGELWSTQKAAALREFGAEMYVGDHVGDIAGAREAEALAIGVATGPMSTADLTIAGADVVWTDLTMFGPWLDTYLAATVH